MNTKTFLDMIIYSRLEAIHNAIAGKKDNIVTSK